MLDGGDSMLRTCFTKHAGAGWLGARRAVLLFVLPISLVLVLPAAALASAPVVNGDPPSSITSGGATLNALVNPQGESTQYHFDYDQDSSPWCQSGGASSSPAGTTTPATVGFTDSSYHEASTPITGLTPNTGYCFRVVASNTDGPTTGGMSGFTTLTSAPVVSTGSASGITGVSATLNGTVNPEGQSTQYQFDYDYTRDAWCQSGGTSGSPAGHTTAATLGFTDSSAHAVSAAITGFSPGDSICFAVDATNSVQAVGTTATFTTTALVVSTGSASSVINGGATLSGSINPEDQPTTSYYFQDGPASSGACTSTDVGQATASTSLGFADSTTHAVSASVTGLTPSTTYCFRLAESNASFQFKYGAFATFTTLPPVTLTVHATGNGEVDSSDLSNSIQCGGATALVPMPASDCMGSYVQGTTVTLTESPYHSGGGEEGDAHAAAVAPSFIGWSGACSGAGSTCTVTMEADTTVAARFTGASQSPVAGAVSSALKVNASIAAILGHGGYPTTASVPVPGTLTITWYSGSFGTHATRSVVVASGSKTFNKAGAAKLKIKLTHAGRALLKHAKHLKLTVAGSFKPKQGKKVTKQRTIRLTG
jgi:hypothetical protein